MDLIYIAKEKERFTNSIHSFQSPIKLMKQCHEIKQNWTGLDYFDTSFFFLCGHLGPPSGENAVGINLYFDTSYFDTSFFLVWAHWPPQRRVPKLVPKF